VTAGDQYMVECMLTGAEFMEYISILAAAAGSASTFSELGLYFLVAQEELIGDRAGITATMFICEDAYPRFFQSTISALGDWVDACAQVSNYSSTSTDDRCMDLSTSASVKMTSMSGRITEVAEWVSANS
jgi:hypothetical protein